MPSLKLLVLDDSTEQEVGFLLFDGNTNLHLLKLSQPIRRSFFVKANTDPYLDTDYSIFHKKNIEEVVGIGAIEYRDKDPIIALRINSEKYRVILTKGKK